MSSQKCASGYKIGHQKFVEDPKMMPNESTNVCLYALGSLVPYLTPLLRELMKDD